MAELQHKRCRRACGSRCSQNCITRKPAGTGAWKTRPSQAASG